MVTLALEQRLSQVGYSMLSLQQVPAKDIPKSLVRNLKKACLEHGIELSAALPKQTEGVEAVFESNDEQSRLTAYIGEARLGLGQRSALVYLEAALYGATGPAHNDWLWFDSGYEPSSRGEYCADLVMTHFKL